MRQFRTLLAALALAATAAPICAAPISFQIKPAQSTLSLSGVIRGTGASFFPIGQPISGSLATAYAGNLLVDSNLTQIVFMGGNVDASINGNYLPGPSSADYGLTASLPAPEGNLLAAIRDFAMSFNGLATPLVSGFDMSSVTVTAVGGTFESDKLAPLPFAGATAAQVSGTGTLFSSGDLRTLSLPLTIGFSQEIPNSDYTLEFTLAGTLVATHTVPEPATGLLLAAGAVALTRRRRHPRT